MAEEKRTYQKKIPDVIDITTTGEPQAVKPFVEIEFQFKGESQKRTLKANSMTHAHGKLNKMCEERGVNYRKAFEFHNVIQGG